MKGLLLGLLGSLFAFSALAGPVTPPGALINGIPTTGNCVSWANSRTVQDAGVTCGSGGSVVFYTGNLAGSANTYTLAATGFTLTDQYVVQASVNATNTASSTINVNSTGATTVKKQTSSGLQNLSGGELVSGNQYLFTYQAACTCYVVTTVLASAGTVATTGTVTAAEWANWAIETVTAASVTRTLPVSTSLATNGGIVIQAIGNSVTLAPNAADAINGGTTGASVTIAAGVATFIRTDGAGNIYASPLSGGAGSGTVTSVALSMPSGIYNVTGSPVTTSGTLTATPTGTSGGIPYFSSSTSLASSAALTANNPVIGGGAGVAPSVGTRAGNTTSFATTTGTFTSGNCVQTDVNHNLVDSGGTCGGGGGGGSPGGTGSEVQYRGGASTFSAVTSASTANGINLGSAVAPVTGDSLDIDQTLQGFWNTTDHTTNYEKAALGFATNTFTIKTSKGGTGTSRSILLDASAGTGQSITLNASAGGGLVLFQVNGNAVAYVQSTGMRANTTGWSLSSSAPTATVPSIIPNVGSPNTGWGSQAAGNMSGIIGGTESWRLTSSGEYVLNSFQVGSLTALTLAQGEIGLIKITASGTAPGAAGLKLAAVCGTNAGTAKIIAYAGTSTSPVTVVDNVGSAVTGC